MGSFRAFLVVLAAWVLGATALLRVLFGSAPSAPTDPATLGADAAGNLALQSGSLATDTVPPQISVSPVGGTYAAAQAVTLAVNERGARLYYTLDGSEPTPASMEYRGPFAIIRSVTLKVLAVDLAGNASRCSAVYQIERRVAPPSMVEPTPAPAPGTGSATQGGAEPIPG